MRSFFIFLLFSLFIFSNMAFAQPPIYRQNAPIVQDGNPAVCNASWKGRIDPEEIANYIRFNDDQTLSGPGIRSCTGCAMAANNNCVCKSCYDYFDNL